MNPSYMITYARQLVELPSLHPVSKCKKTKENETRTFLLWEAAAMTGAGKVRERNDPGHNVSIIV